MFKNNSVTKRPGWRRRMQSGVGGSRNGICRSETVYRSKVTAGLSSSATIIET